MEEILTHYRKFSDILKQDAITGIHIVGFDLVRTKDQQGVVKEEGGQIFADADEYRQFVKDLLRSRGYTPGRDIAVYRFMDTENPKYNLKVTVSWLADGHPYVHFRKIVKNTVLVSPA